MPGTLFPFALLALFAASCGEPVPEVPAPPSEFVRFVPPEESDAPRLETAVTTYTGPGGAVVELVSALHIADSRHYAELQELFTGHDALLYELVAEEGARPSGEDRAGGVLSLVQRGMKNAFDLDFQLDAIDYTPDNFVHADLTPEGFTALMEERGETFLTLFLRMMLAEMGRSRGEQGEAAARPLDLVTAFQNREGRHALRLMFAAQMTQVEQLAAGFSGPDGESVLVEGRNKRAMEVLDREIAAGRKRLGIYYGAAHMPDFERRLLARGFTKTAERWLTAWDLRKRPDPVPPRYQKDR